MIATVASALLPWYCHGCGRMEDSCGQTCPDCRSRRQHVSRYEWALADAIEDRLALIGLPFTLDAQWPIRDPRGFTWYFDLRVAVRGCAEVIEVNGNGHLDPKSHDDAKWRAFVAGTDPGTTFRIVANDECRKGRVAETAAITVASLLRRAGC